MNLCVYVCVCVCMSVCVLSHVYVFNGKFFLLKPGLAVCPLGILTRGFVAEFYMQESRAGCRDVRIDVLHFLDLLDLSLCHSRCGA